VASRLLRAAALWVLALLCTGFRPVTAHERAVELLATLTAEGLAATDVTVNDRGVGHGKERRRVRTYVPARPLGRTLVVAHGVHHLGIDEPRLMRFARRSAELGYHVVTPELPDLADYRVTAASADVIARTVQSAASAPDLPGGPVGLIGISFGGGLSLLAASRPEVSSKLAYVASLGGHHDLRRVLRFFLTNVVDTPSGPEARPAHEYGVTILALSALDALAPAEDVPTLRVVFRHWLTEDRGLARRQAGALTTERGRELFELLEQGRLAQIAPDLERWLDDSGGALGRVSPAGKLRRITAPVYLVHGASDRVIPPSEARWAAQELGDHEHALLVTSLIEHVMPDRPAPLLERLRLVDLVAHLLPDGVASRSALRSESK
jgi:pimeloyl-ACP methyl ester carboxylesterase